MTTEEKIQLINKIYSDGFEVEPEDHKSNKYLLDLEDKFTRKHNEIDRIALVIAADDAGVENVDGLLDRFLKTRQQIASDLFTDSKSDRSLTYTKYDIAKRIQTVIDWKRWQILFPLLRDYWNK